MGEPDSIGALVLFETAGGIVRTGNTAGFSRDTAAGAEDTLDFAATGTRRL